MALEQLSLDRQQVFYAKALAFGAGQTYPTALGFAATAYEINRAAGNAWLRGYISGTTAPAAGFPRIRFWPSPGDAATVTPGPFYVLPVDPANALNFLIDGPLISPFFTIEWTQGAAPGTVTGAAWVLPDGSGTVFGTAPAPPAPAILPATYRVAFDGLVFTTVGGTILQLANPAASGRVLRVTLQLLSKPSATTRWKVLKQSALSTGGAFTTPTPVPLDSTDAATVGVVSLYTDNTGGGGFVPGASLGNVWDLSLTAADTFSDSPGGNTDLDQPIVLRPGESEAWTSDVAGTYCGAIEFSDSAV